MILHTISDGVFKILRDGLLDDEDHVPEPGAVGVEEGEVQDGMSGVVHGHDLFEPAEAAPHSGGHDDKRGRGHRNTSVYLYDRCQCSTAGRKRQERES